MNKNLYSKITEKYPNGVKINENLKKYHTFKTNGNADIIAQPESIDELVDMVKICKENNYKFILLGNGSNILFKEGSFDGVIVTTRKLCSIDINEDKITCSCGAPMPLVAQKTLRSSLTGFERLSGIPGTIGGAVLMNAGAYGVEMKDILTSVTICDEDYNIREINPDELDLTYRHSNVLEKGYIVLSCELTLKKGDFLEIDKTMTTLKEKRLVSQPLEYPNAGSIFKREGDLFAGQLIDECGLKGYQIGGAVVSTKHANFIINKDGASHKDIIDLISYVKETVYNAKSVKLNTEIMFI